MKVTPKITALVTFVLWAPSLALSGEPQAHRATANHQVTLRQPGGPTSDIDVIEREVPIFRILVPEHLTAEDAHGPVYDDRTFIHVVKGQWTSEHGRLRGAVKLSGDLDLGITLEPRARGVLMSLAVTNLSDRDLLNVRANVCSGVSRLPDKTPWSNRAFIPPSVPLDRGKQGQYWYEQLTRTSLQAWLPDRGWIRMNVEPPGSKQRDLYAAVQSSTDAARLCAVESLDRKSLFFQGWKARCYYLSPFRGNACMHLLPLVAARLPARQTATIRGAVGIYDGSRSDLAKEFDKMVEPH